MKQTERNFWLDCGLFITFISIAFTGALLWLVLSHQTSAVFLGIHRSLWFSVHIGSGLAGIAGNVIHIIWHRGWLKALRNRPMASLSLKQRANRVTDKFVWGAFITAAMFGVLDWIIPVFGNRVSIFGRLHVAFAIAWLIGITVHLTLHRKWIISVSRRHLWIKKSEMGIIQSEDVKALTFPNR